MLEIRDNPEYRDRRRRNGSVYENKEGELGLGSFSLKGRFLILKKLLELEVETGLELITLDELKMIDRMWEQEGELTRRKLVDLYYEVKGSKLPWDEYKTPLFGEDAFTTIHETCEEFGIDYDMFAKLVVAVENNKHYTRGQKINKAFDKVINEGWLHYQNIKNAKEELDNED